MPGVLDPAARDSIQSNVSPVIPPAHVEIRRREYPSDFAPLLKRLVGRYFLRASYGR